MLVFGGSGTLFWGAALGAEQWGDVHVKLQHGNVINATQRLRGRAVGLNWIAGALLLLERQGCGLCSSFFFVMLDIGSGGFVGVFFVGWPLGKRSGFKCARSVGRWLREV